MKLSKDIKDKINNEYTSWKENMYAGKTVEERQAMGQFFTPPEISIRMLENFSDTNGTILVLDYTKHIQPLGEPIMEGNRMLDFLKGLNKDRHEIRVQVSGAELRNSGILSDIKLNVFTLHISLLLRLTVLLK